MTATATSAGTARLVLAGPPGVGKTTVGRAAAARLDAPALDLDALVEARAGRSPADVIRDDGEATFRTLEAETLETFRQDAVLSLGGGTLTTSRGRAAARRLGPVVGLEAPVETLQARLQGPGEPDRPLLAGGLEDLLARRKLAYAAVDRRVDAGGDMDRVADEVSTAATSVRLCFAEVGDTTSRVVVGRDLAPAIAGALAHLAPKRPVLAIVDTGIPESARRDILSRVQALLPTHVVEVPGGEPVKQWAVAGQVLESALAAGCGRQSAVLGLGGGATCDLAGLVAHLIGRGAPLVLAPSTLLAQVDASVGGKCAVNMEAGRNLAGAFHPATDVVADLDLLESLPAEEYRSGLAELLKIGAIADAALFDAVVEAGRADIEHIARAVTLKAEVVRADPYESGVRKTLNLGHTLGHALEAASGFTMRHGEAVAMGLAAVARYSVTEGWARESEARRLVRGLEAVGLPISAPEPLLARAGDHIGADKKSAGDEVALVRFHEVGRVSVQTRPLAEARAGLVRHGGLD